jgi:CRP-like cAMP-binding protein
LFEVLKNYIEKRVALTETELAGIKSVTTIKKLRKKQYLLQEGDVWSFHAFVAKGCLRTYTIDDKGLEHIIYFAIENWWTGDRESLLSGKPATFNIDAVEDSEVALINKANFEKLCRDIPAFNTMVSEVLEKSLAATQHRITATISYTAEQKYQQFLKKYP